LPEPSCLFDLSEDGFDDLLTQAVATSAAGALELGASSWRSAIRLLKPFSG
jgi:hypothetical protein